MTLVSTDPRDCGNIVEYEDIIPEPDAVLASSNRDKVIFTASVLKFTVLYSPTLTQIAAIFDSTYRYKIYRHKVNGESKAPVKSPPWFQC